MWVSWVLVAVVVVVVDFGCGFRELVIVVVDFGYGFCI